VDGRDKGRWRDATHQRLEELAEARLAVVVEHQHRLDHLEASEGKWKEKKKGKEKRKKSRAVFYVSVEDSAWSGIISGLNVEYTYNAVGYS
jgi:hypothetical protein